MGTLFKYVFLAMGSVFLFVLSLGYFAGDMLKSNSTDSWLRRNRLHRPALFCARQHRRPLRYVWSKTGDGTCRGGT